MQSQEQEQVKHIPTIDIDVKNLPSRGIAYPDDATLNYRTYSFGEVKQTSASTMTMDRALKLTLSGLTANFDVQKLTVMDAMYLGVLRKISSFNKMEFELPFRCGECGLASTSHHNHKDLEFNDLSKRVTKLPLRVTLSGKELHFSPLTVADFLTLKSGRYKKIVKGEHDNDRVSVMAMMCSNMDFEKAYKLLYDISDPDDMEVLAEIDELLEHSLKRVKAVCKNDDCREENYVKLEGMEALLTPFRDGKRPPRNRIQFGDAPESECVPN